MKDCKYFDKCSASLCPLNKDMENKIWYPNEEICKLYRNRQFIKTQKKIAKKARNRDTFYTYNMLNKNIRVTAAIEGINSDKEMQPQIIKWNKTHPEITEEEIKALSDRAKAVLGAHNKGSIHDKKSKKPSIPNEKIEVE